MRRDVIFNDLIMEHDMHLNRRQIFALGAGAAIGAATGMTILPAAAAEGNFDQLVKDFTGGAEVASGRVSLSTPEIAENGNTVPVSFEVESAMTADDYVAEVLVLAEGNPQSGVARFKFSSMSGVASASTRIRLAKTQNVVAIAKMSDGSLFMDKKTIKVTIGGCGG